MHLLDTSACIRLLNGTSPQLARRLAAEDPREVSLCAIVQAELCFGARKSQRVEHNLAVLRRFFAAFECLPFDPLAAEHYGVIRADLERHGRPIGPNDLLIAAIARARDAVLVSANTGEFARIPGLRLVNWES